MILYLLGAAKPEAKVQVGVKVTATKVETTMEVLGAVIKATDNGNDPGDGMTVDDAVDPQVGRGNDSRILQNVHDERVGALLVDRDKMVHSNHHQDL